MSESTRQIPVHTGSIGPSNRPPFSFRDTVTFAGVTKPEADLSITLSFIKNREVLYFFGDIPHVWYSDHMVEFRVNDFDYSDYVFSVNGDNCPPWKSRLHVQFPPYSDRGLSFEYLQIEQSPNSNQKNLVFYIKNISDTHCYFGREEAILFMTKLRIPFCIRCSDF